MQHVAFYFEVIRVKALWLVAVLSIVQLSSRQASSFIPYYTFVACVKAESKKINNILNREW
jgi:hypothetical protein